MLLPDGDEDMTHKDNMTTTNRQSKKYKYERTSTPIRLGENFAEILGSPHMDTNGNS